MCLMIMALAFSTTLSQVIQSACLWNIYLYFSYLHQQSWWGIMVSLFFFCLSLHLSICLSVSWPVHPFVCRPNWVCSITYLPHGGSLSYLVQILTAVRRCDTFQMNHCEYTACACEPKGIHYNPSSQCRTNGQMCYKCILFPQVQLNSVTSFVTETFL